MAMIYDSEGRNHLRWTVRELRRMAWILRDRLSSDAWRILNQFDSQLAEPRSGPPALTAALSLLEDMIVTLSAFNGLVTESISRGDGCFVEIGRRLERALQMVGILRYGLLPEGGDESGKLQALLEIADSSRTYRARYFTSMQADLVLDWLLLDDGNPRSIAFQLARLHERFEELPRLDSAELGSSRWRIATGLLTAVHLAQASELIAVGVPVAAGLEALLNKVSSGLRELSDALARDYFEHTPASYPLLSGG